MQHALKSLLHTIKKTLENFGDEQKSISFLVATGLREQGTSTVLRQGQMHQQFTDEELGIHVFYNKKGIIIDINQQWVNQQDNLLPMLFKKINQCHRKLRISGFLFFVDIADLLISDEEQYVAQIKEHSQFFLEFIQALDYPVRSGIVITKLDQITGFTDFFNLSHELELQEPLGFSVTYAKQNPNFPKIFSEAWNNFVSYLNQQMIQKIHTTRANKQRILIREFPLQMALMESRFLNLVKNLAHPKTHIHGLFFTCAEQKSKNLNYLNKRIQSDFSVLVPVSSVQSVNFKHFFIHGAISHCQELSSYTPKPNALYDTKVQAILLAGFLTASIIIYQTIRTHDVLQQTDHHLQQPFTKNIADHQISVLEKHLQELNHLPYMFKYMSNIETLNQQISNIEQNIYERHLAYKVSMALQNQMMSNDIYMSFEALKISMAILMKKHNQDKAIYEWFSHNYAQDLSDHEKQQQLTLLKKFIWNIRWHFDDNIIQTTQNNLNSLPEEYLVFELINQALIHKTTEIAAPGFEQSKLQIPECYTKAAYHETQKKLQHQFDNLKNNTWVLGQEINPNLKERLEAHYAEKYVKFWENLIYKNLRPHHFSTFKDALSLFKTLETSKSFENIMGLVLKETAPNTNSPNDPFNQLIANHFTELHFSYHQNPQLHQFWEDLSKFTSMFAMIDDNGRASFQYLRAYFNQNQYNDALYNITEYSKRMPEPTHAWLKQIQEDMWLTIEQSTKQYINHAWQEQVYQPYLSMIDHKYPFENSPSEVGINDFNTFFSPNGKLQQFFKDYLQPFVNTNQAQWSIKEVDNKRLPILEGVIESLMRSNIISNVFFPNNAPQTHVQFSIEKMSLDPVISNLSLFIGQQQLLDNQEENAYLQGVTWPETNASLQINTIEGKRYGLDEKGTWGLFRLFDKINIIGDPNDPTTVQMLIEINGNSGRYLVKANNSLNPFLPGIFKDFKLKEKVV